MESKLKIGKIQVYTGDGKGKSTAALGLALRAAGRDFKVFICQFMKGRNTGEYFAIRKFLSDNIYIHLCGSEKFILDRENPPEEEKHRAREGLEISKQAMLSGKYDIVILDEVNVAIYYNLIDEKEVLEFLKEKPENVELILTGRKTPSSIIELADLVTEMREIKHYYKNGLLAREGIEY